MNLYKSSGPLRYVRGSRGGFKVIVEVDQGIANYYRSLIPKWVRTNPQMYDAHISVVRKEVPPRMEAWGKREGAIADFLYEPSIHSDGTYFWINVFSRLLEEVRTELGLPITGREIPSLDGFQRFFHCTIANTKGL